MCARCHWESGMIGRTNIPNVGIPVIGHGVGKGHGAPLNTAGIEIGRVEDIEILVSSGTVFVPIAEHGMRVPAIRADVDYHRPTSINLLFGLSTKISLRIVRTCGVRPGEITRSRHPPSIPHIGYPIGFHACGRVADTVGGVEVGYVQTGNQRTGAHTKERSHTAVLLVPVAPDAGRHRQNLGASAARVSTSALEIDQLPLLGRSGTDRSLPADIRVVTGTLGGEVEVVVLQLDCVDVAGLILGSQSDAGIRIIPSLRIDVAVARIAFAGGPVVVQSIGLAQAAHDLVIAARSHDAPALGLAGALSPQANVPVVGHLLVPIHIQALACAGMGNHVVGSVSRKCHDNTSFQFVDFERVQSIRNISSGKCKQEKICGKFCRRLMPYYMQLVY